MMTRRYPSDVEPDARLERPYGRLIGVGLTLLLVSFSAIGCDTQVDAFQPTDEFIFSIFGVVNPAADTQFIRIEALDDSIQVGAPPDIDASATLENLGSGVLIALQDSFMEIPGRGVFVHNFWTAEAIEPGATYRLNVVRSDGSGSWATTTVPEVPPHISHNDRFVLPCMGVSGANTFEVELSRADRLAALQVLYPLEEGVAEIDHFDNVVATSTRTFAVIDYGTDLEPYSPDMLNQRCAHPPFAQIVAVAGGPDWPDFTSAASLDELARPDSFTNVMNGVGLFGGVFSDTLVIQSRPREE